MIQVDSEKCIIGLHCPVKMASVSYSDGTRLEGRQRCKYVTRVLIHTVSNATSRCALATINTLTTAALSSITRALRSDS